MSNPTASLPPGFRFHPTDEELILHYLRNRAASTPCPVSIIAEVDIYKFDPWDLPEKAMFGDREWYFFSPRDRKYPNGVRPNRAAASGYWKATGTDKPIHAGNENVGVKKALVFYKGRPPKGMKTGWIMHEYRLAGAGNANGYGPTKLRHHSMRLDDWVLCRIYNKCNNLSSAASPSTDQEHEDSSNEETYIQSFPNINAQENTVKLAKSSSISEFLVDYASLSHLYDTQPELPVSDFNSLLAGTNSSQHFINSNNNDNGTGSNYLVPYQLESEPSSVQDQDGPSKRQRMNDSCPATNFSNQFDGSSQYLSFFNQQMLLNSHFGCIDNLTDTQKTIN